MSRWTTDFNNHPFHDAWKKLNDTLNATDMTKAIDENALQEINRLKKSRKAY